MMSLMQHRDSQPSDITILSVYISDARMGLSAKGWQRKEKLQDLSGEGGSIIPANCRGAINNKLVLSSTMKLTEAKILDGVL